MTETATGEPEPGQRLRWAMAALAQNAPIDEIAGTLLDRECAATGARAGVVVLLDGPEVLEVAAWTGYDDDFIEGWQRFPLDAATPLSDAVRSRATVVVESLEEFADRYPGVEPADTRPHALAAFPLVAGDDVLGAVGLRFDVTPVSPRVVLTGQAVTDTAAESLTLRRSVDALSLQVAQLRQALDSRIIIEQAKGVLAERHAQSTSEAFERLRRHARNSSRRLHAVAAEVVRGELDL